MEFNSCWEEYKELCQEIIQEVNNIRKSPKSFV